VIKLAPSSYGFGVSRVGYIEMKKKLREEYKRGYTRGFKEGRKEYRNLCRKLKQILQGEIGPKLTLNYEEDARYVYPERIKLTLKEIREKNERTNFI